MLGVNLGVSVGKKRKFIGIREHGTQKNNLAYWQESSENRVVSSFTIVTLH